MNEFAHGKCDSQFMNLAFNINPVLLTTVPYSTLGTGMILPPTKDPNQAIVSFMVLSSTGKASTSGFDDLDGNNLTFAGEGRVRTDFLRTHWVPALRRHVFQSEIHIDRPRPRASSSRTARSKVKQVLETFSTSRRKARAKASASSAASAHRTAIPTSCISSTAWGSAAKG